MPYKSIGELPPPVKDNLPTHAEEIYLAAFNSAWEKHGKDENAEITCTAIAWSAVKRAYKKNTDGTWVTKEAVHPHGEHRRNNYIWAECLQCKTQRWVRLDCLKRKNFTGLCHSCNSKNQIPDSGKGAAHASWKGGRRRTDSGYILIWLASENFFYPMAKVNGCVYEHRLVVAKSLKRCLLPWEVVHHINGVKDDNRLENLRLLPDQGSHNTQIEKQLKKLLSNQDKLMQEIKLLRFENKQLREGINA